MALLTLARCSSESPEFNFTFDIDTDDDGVTDIADFCRTGEESWRSNASTDYDSDGCKDNHSEEIDTDNDYIPDEFDACKKSLLGFKSTRAIDHDSDGCQDATEDADDDNDGIPDTSDQCPLGETFSFLGNTMRPIPIPIIRPLEEKPSSFIESDLIFQKLRAFLDADGDGCQDAIEDEDDDNDNIKDTYDHCPKPASWGDTLADLGEELGFSGIDRIFQKDYILFDADGDNCQDSTGDTDDDNDGISDAIEEQCGYDAKDNRSIPLDSDGDKECNEIDIDDDNDGISDSLDMCPIAFTNDGWISDSSGDTDANGCRDTDQDSDFDGDGIINGMDACPNGNMGWSK